VPDPGALNGGVPAALLLIESAEEQVHLPVNYLLGVGLRTKAIGTLALIHILAWHGSTLRELSVRPQCIKKLELIPTWPLRLSRHPLLRSPGRTAHRIVEGPGKTAK
jgi:hypothetical protein